MFDFLGRHRFAPLRCTGNRMISRKRGRATRTAKKRRGKRKRKERQIMPRGHESSGVTGSAIGRSRGAKC